MINISLRDVQNNKMLICLSIYEKGGVMKESTVKNAHSMFQPIENQMKNILGEKESEKPHSSKKFDEKFIRAYDIRKAYGMFKNQFKLSLGKGDLPKNTESHNQLK